MTFHHVWLATVAQRVAPLVEAALVRPLVDGGAWVWMENPLLHDRTLGELALEGDDRLVLETWVDGALEHGRKFLRAVAGAAIAFRSVEHLGVQPALRGGVP